MEILVHWTFFLLGLLVLVGYGVSGGLATVGVLAALFSCVLLHELGH